ncbi:hypothetical protein O3G_MSEX014726 [Manduca sexta]|uniref:Uncharacterized protein n=1 Tax=Manduca sexta TaxID=7130 RepID=A0A921ZVN0_MANSE|nr:hypothetical protein O3G_MSEX014726 [Manduca sexta]
MTCHYFGIRSVAMLLALIICHVLALSFANPFHKYPFVFLLDVGNEELESVNTQQIRISTPGGSIALRYPAVGEGDNIAHVRVSGIDFGTDLKANIVDGGPGYKYVVLVFMGNPGRPYDAVLTVQTVPDTTKDVQDNSASIENDPNDSAEDLSDNENREYLESSKAELMQSSSNVYNYAHDNNEGYIENNDYISQKDIHIPYSESFSSDETVEVKDYSEDDEDDENLYVIPKDEENDDDNEDDNGNNNEEGPSDDKVEQSEVFDEEDDPNFNNEYNDKSADYDDSEELDQTFNDEEVHGEKYKDSNNNYEDNDDSSAVAY